MNILLFIVLGIAGLLALLDLIFANTGNGRRYWLLPVSVLLVILVLILQAAGVG